jgi:hypothetical protein
MLFPASQPFRHSSHSSICMRDVSCATSLVLFIFVPFQCRFGLLPTSQSKPSSCFNLKPATSEMFASRRTGLDLAATWSSLCSLFCLISFRGMLAVGDSWQSRNSMRRDKSGYQNKHMSASMSYKTRRRHSITSHVITDRFPWRAVIISPALTGDKWGSPILPHLMVSIIQSPMAC